MVSRSIDVDKAISATLKGQHVVIKGRSGAGKSHLLREVSDCLTRDSGFILVYLPPVTIRQVLLQAAEKLHDDIGLRLHASFLAPKFAARARMGHRLVWDEIKRTISRFTVPDLVSTIAGTIEGRSCVFVVDSLEVPSTYFDVLEKPRHRGQILT